MSDSYYAHAPGHDFEVFGHAASCSYGFLLFFFMENRNIFEGYRANSVKNKDAYLQTFSDLLSDNPDLYRNLKPYIEIRLNQLDDAHEQKYGDFLHPLHEFLVLCSQYEEFCTLPALSVFASLVTGVLRGPERFYNEIKPMMITHQRKIDSGWLHDVIKSKLKKVETDYFNRYPVEEIDDICMATLQEFFSEGKVIKQCENCGKFFVPANKTDTKYCPRVSPQYGHLSCGEAAKYIRQQERLKGNDLERQYKTAYNTIRNRLNSKKAEENPEMRLFYEELLRDLPTHNREKKELLSTGKITEAQYLEWLCEVKARRA